MNFNQMYKPDYQNFTNLLSHIGSSLNGRKDRFDKADLIEQGFCCACNSMLVWTDDIGFDLIDPKRNIKFEVKSQANCLYTGKGRLKPSTSKIKLTNTLQQAKNKNLLVTADWLIIIDSVTGAVGIIDYAKVVKEFSFEMEDGFGCQIPMDKIEIISEPITAVIGHSPSYKKQKQIMQEKYVKEFFK